ncbi:FecCD family ABC transporter permease [Nocardia mangyaensis]|uniref:FecCD family ABC transporter permease n=1 Tax=Nocardia mangyaensis TaxID=2213200 RepID=UPI002675A222|nr:iron chelate uptake ABC transporter family permease subunit [Nocardia mangyaensis]MDO3645509.1 iron chelate uptake ABC transporter family permease subunit [Nocardia mangyaensis]
MSSTTTAEDVVGTTEKPVLTKATVTSNRGRALGLVVAALILLVALVLSLTVGTRDIALGTVWDALWHYDGSPDQLVVRSLRVPRTMLGLLVGMALGVAGALIQALTRNPLADPGILGVNAGAAFFVALAVAIFGFTSIWSYVWFAFLGAVVVTVAVYALGSLGRGGTTPIRITLSGVAIGAVLTGITNGLMLIDPKTFDHLRFWFAGSIAGADLDVVWAVSGFVALGLLLGLSVARPLNSIALGDDLARSLGVDIKNTRTLGIIAVTLLCGAATAAAGPIGFVGLMVPHVARWLVGPDQRWILPYTVFGAATLVLLSDVLGRIVLRPAELQVGIVTAFVGAPVLILLVRRKKASGL